LEEELSRCVELAKLFQVNVEIEIKLDWLLGAAAFAVAIHVVFQLPTLPQNLIAPIGGSYFHDRARRIPVIPLHDKLAVRRVLANASALPILHTLEPHRASDALCAPSRVASHTPPDAR
jgi:hypothetical protein